MLKPIYLLLIIVTFVKLSNALYFHIGETERKCFIEEIPDETNVIGETYFCLQKPLNEEKSMLNYYIILYVVI